MTDTFSQNEVPLWVSFGTQIYLDVQDIFEDASIGPLEELQPHMITEINKFEDLLKTIGAPLLSKV